MNLKIETKLRKDLARDALDAKLYVRGWTLQGDLNTILTMRDCGWEEQGVKPHDIAVAYDGQEPIGVIILTEYMFSIYVKPKYRFMGVGKALYQKLIEITQRDYLQIPFAPGIKGSETFFKKINHNNVVKCV